MAATLELKRTCTMGSVPCSTCGGTGFVTRNNMQYLCSTCGGSGRITYATELMPMMMACGNCGGTGFVEKNNLVYACDSCHGSGRVNE